MLVKEMNAVYMENHLKITSAKCIVVHCWDRLLMYVEAFEEQ
jgi:hypothetical protein